MFDKNKLKAKMVEKGYSIEQIAQKLGVNPGTVYRKLSGDNEFTRNEIAMLKSILGLTIEEIDNIFFHSNLRIRNNPAGITTVQRSEGVRG